MSRVDKIGYRTKAIDDNTYEFVMSDESVDRVGDIIVAKGWDLSEFKRNPIALYGHSSFELPIGTWEKVHVEGQRLLGRLKMAAEGTSPFIDAVRSLLKQGVLKTVSVGFLPIKREPIEDSPVGGVKFTKQSLLECSVVAVPANPNALALSLRSFSPEVQRQLASVSALPPRAQVRAVSGHRNPDSRGKSMSLSERIQAAEAELVALRDEQAPLLKMVNEGDDDLNDDQQAEFDRLEADITKVQKRIDTMRATEKSLGQAAARQTVIPPDGGTSPGTPSIILPTQRQVHKPAKERPMDLLVKLGVLHFKAFCSRQTLDVVRQQTYPDRIDMDAVVKAVTNPAATTVAGWAAELVETAIDDFIQTLVPISVYARLSGMGIRFTFGRNGVLKIPRRNRVKNGAGDLRGAFVGEGQPIPVRRGSVGSISLTPHKMGVISDYTREMAAHSTPAIEGLIREGIVEDTADAIDTALLDAVAGDTVRPAGLLNGVSGIAGTAGGGIAAMTADIAAILQPFITANAADRLVFLINPTNVFKLQWASTAVGVYPFRDQVSAGNIGGIPFIQSTNVPATVLILMRYADFASSTADTPEFDVSDVATLHEDDGSYPADQAMRTGTATVLPIVDAAGVAAKPVRSLWQTASIGIRMLLDMDWAMRRAGMVQQVTAITW